MLEAKKSRLFENIFAVYNKNLLRRRFASFNVSGLENLQNLSLPCLIFANHSSWWDGLIAFEISNSLRLDSFIMMEEKQLEKLQFFRKLGAFSVVREKPREAIKSVDYAVKLFNEKPGRMLWIFPQGVILPNDLRPLKFFGGIAHIVEKLENCAVVPTAMRLEFLGKFKPEIFVKFGAPEIFSSENFIEKKLLTENFKDKLTKLLDELKNDVIEGNFADYQNIL